MHRILAALGMAVLLVSTMLVSRGTTTGSTTIVVNPASLNGWVLTQETATATGAFIAGPGTPPMGTGSASMTTVNSTGGEILATTAYAGTPFSTMDDLEYSTYSSVAPQAIALQFEIDYNLTDLNTSFAGRLVYEPYLSGGTVLAGTWQTWDPHCLLYTSPSPRDRG
jgi:hypothetical protein